MITTPVPVVLELPQGAPRSPGVHISSIIRCIATEAGILKPEWVEELSLVDAGRDGWWESLDATSQIRIMVGLAWEEWYLARLPDVIKHPGEICIDGIYMTPDGESLSVIITVRGPRHTLAIHEVKVTYKSLRTVAPRHVTGNPDDPADLETQWMWLQQIRAYCKGANTTVGFLHVLFLCGDYTYPIRPRLGPYENVHCCWRIEFTQAEIDEAWKLNVDYKKEFEGR